MIHGLGINPLLEDSEIEFMDPDAKWMPHITEERAATILRESPKQFASQFCARCTDEELTAMFRLAKAHLELDLDRPLAPAAFVSINHNEMTRISEAVSKPGWHMLAGPRQIISRLLQNLRSE